ncbi:M20/M25/M40 family metallo-hydrolase [Asticcacaulis sp. DXS10W]|uniref:M20/M25/M40 family metallo-hydrolase n=1 Tax=Asticcacaulis currens TaxID=2984210 RepID=A0ABT5IDI1_9CAUL|nr:M20/M25/M40 family metallo-hydrolase [Asticcacaulis currens]MDC7694236.1 M20/M25/M40 family metallo-hydrolase [Asticcacaulis currens]
MDFVEFQRFIDAEWAGPAMRTLQDYIAIPVQSPAFDDDWETNGFMDEAVGLLAGWASRQILDIPGATIEILSSPGVTPAIYIDIPGRLVQTVLIYGHLDKQPPMDGWTNGRGPWSPVVEGDRLYGRGGADDGYAIFSALIALKAIRAQGLEHPRCMILIEACEESGSLDLEGHLASVFQRTEDLDLIVALDAGAADYDSLWVTTSVRGQVAGTLTVQTLTETIHSGDGAGVVPTAFRIACQLLARLEDPQTGDVDPQFLTFIPELRRVQAVEAGPSIAKTLFAALPLAGSTRLVSDDAAELVLNRSWTSQLTVTGIDGLPTVAKAAAAIHPQVQMKLSLRLPPTLDAELAALALKKLLEADPPYGCSVTFDAQMISQGWEAPAMGAGLTAALNRAASDAFGGPVRYFGGGGGIPFLASLSERFPGTPFLVTGVLGPQSNAHGPNEFLHLPTARRITAVLGRLLSDLD